MKLEIKSKLSQLNDLRIEISELQFKIEKLEKKGIVIGNVEASYKKPPYTKHNISIEASDPRYINKMNDLKQTLQLRLNNLLELQNEIEKFISGLPTSRLRRIFELRYINQFSWQKIAYTIGGYATKDSVRKEHDRFLKEN
mgnify:CR=1 FL=1